MKLLPLAGISALALDRDVRIVVASYQLSGNPIPATAPPPSLGEHPRAVLAEAGFSNAEIAALAEDGVI